MRQGGDFKKCERETGGGKTDVCPRQGGGTTDLTPRQGGSINKECPRQGSDICADLKKEGSHGKTDRKQTQEHPIKDDRGGDRERYRENQRGGSAFGPPPEPDVRATALKRAACASPRARRKSQPVRGGGASSSTGSLSPPFIFLYL